MKLSLQIFKAEYMAGVLQLANKYAAFDGTISETDLVLSKFFPKGFWVAEEDNEVVGFVFGYFKDVPSDVLTRWGASKVGEISLLVVHPDHRRRGVGTALLRKVMQEFKRAGADQIILACPAEAMAAKRLYDKLGFEVRAYYMKKKL